MASKDKKQPEKKDDSSNSEMLNRLKTRPLVFIGTLIVLIIVVIAFVFLPAIVPSAQGAGELVFGYYNKTPIKYVQNNFFARTQQMLIQDEQLSTDDPNFFDKFSMIWRRAFEETAVRTGILDEMKQAGFMVPDDVVDKYMAELPHFQENGRFSSAKFRAMDNNSRLTLWKEVQESIIINSFLSDVNNLKRASNEASFIASMASPQRTFDMVSFNMSSYPDSDVIAYAEENPNLFRVMRLSRITITSSEREARQILESIKNGTTTFEEAARNNSQDWASDRGGDIGMVMAFEIEYDVADGIERENLIRVTQGNYSDIITTSWGWAFYRVDEAVRSPDYEDTSHLSKIRNYIIAYMRGRAEDWLIGEAERFSADAREVGFDQAINTWEIEKKNFGPISINYGNAPIFSSIISAGILELQNVGTNQRFWRLAFSTPINTLSDPFVFENNVILLYPLEETDADEGETGFIEAYFSYWMSMNTDDAYRTFFLTNKKMDDRFTETFRKLWGE